MSRLLQAYQRAASTTVPLLVVYERPLDHPEKFVVRLWEADKPTLNAWLFDSLEAAREAIPKGLFVIPRADADDKVIVETWL